ncbi:ABC transporter ATP-binding protein [Streptomyces rubiginosohelvolus]|uniref:ABC transporter ATP-binding protein n=1 Tax=Streptomyces TaxID=1883 RepID=UPI000B5CE8DD|nr:MULTISPECIES: ABC transporter ATP-binding protein [unclassified Streptomyces]MBK3532139.1 ABC transporter ATP-binding protein [Streptomyces sp. MBT72]MBK3537994.1 ABC transporter ATP-binding protein [Streptomyces sp. MBT67]MBK3551503.1 ABC transporter ATP-binding protein [Streptomyces sp. MBT61]MBK6030052.1 ABC transporter ATP-binding protein [Streptomyces sp. MBT59]MCA1271117.1 ABC transporter ATP-binding protein [Streptomyces sp. 7G]
MTQPAVQDAPAPADGRTLEFRGLSKRYRDRSAVQDLSFTVRPGRVTGFLGPNGAGKTTTLRMLLGLTAPTSGTATIGGQRYRDLGQPLRTVGAMLDESGTHRRRTGRDHLRVQCAATGLPARRADEVLDQVGLARAGGRRYEEYSLGMRQRLNLAQALLGDPPVLILDEPANGLDPEGIAWMRALLKGLAAEGRTVLVSSHLISEVEQTADDLVIISQGRLVAEGASRDIAARVRGESRVRVRSSRPAELAAALVAAGATVTEPPAEDGLLFVGGLGTGAVAALAAAHGGELYELTEDAPDLEQAFLRLTQGKAEIR